MSGGTVRRRVIGLGNPYRGDDAAGRACIAALLALLAGAGEFCLIAACASGLPAGTVQRFDAATAALPTLGGATSTHGIGLPEAIELARALGMLPRRCVVYAIEGLSYGSGEPLSEPVRTAVRAVAEQIACAGAA
ncbi:MAG: hydrogenase maturation protease [Steroidobacteraceae bacterium]